MEFVDIPERLEDLNADWLSHALRSVGLLDDGKVGQVEQEILGEGEGFMGVVARLHLTFEGNPGSAPERIVAKIPTPVQENRAMGEIMGAYYREIRFYETFGATLPIKTPRCYFTAYDPDPSREKAERIVHTLDRMPMFFVNLLMKLGTKAAMRKGLRYVLLIEDLSPAVAADQVGGGRPEDCEAVVRSAAKLHAQYWGDENLRNHSWLQDHDMNPRMRHGMFRKAMKDFESRYPDLFLQGLDRIVSWMGEHGVALSRALHSEAPQTLIHCDMRFDNVFFDPNQPGSDAILADWQLVGRGAGAYDIAYMLSGALDVETPPEVVDELLTSYHKALIEAGISDYSLANIRRDYERSLLAVMQILATSDAMDMGEDRGVELMDLWTRRAFNLLKNVDLDRIL